VNQPIEEAACLACRLASGSVPLPGGVIHRTGGWAVEHCIGPLGVGTLIVKPMRHVEHVADLTAFEAAELGPLLKLATECVTELANPDQVYVCLWSHAERRPGHIHFVVQPADKTTMARFDAHGPALQVAMFSAGEEPDPTAIAAFAERARRWFDATGVRIR
jgi:diadenosine tetraphosphate (Ap4A) HIT family hydrolase